MRRVRYNRGGFFLGASDTPFQAPTASNPVPYAPAPPAPVYVDPYGNLLPAPTAPGGFNQVLAIVDNGGQPLPVQPQPLDYYALDSRSGTVFYTGGNARMPWETPLPASVNNPNILYTQDQVNALFRAPTVTVTPTNPVPPAPTTVQNPGYITSPEYGVEDGNASIDAPNMGTNDATPSSAGKWLLALLAVAVAANS